MTTPDESALKRFNSYVSKTPGCWEWTGGQSNFGYGVFWFSGRSVGAHRFSLLQTSKPPPNKQWALHRCDNKRCVRPDHLYWGDHGDNTFDAVERSRMAKGKRHGSKTKPHRRPHFERNGNSKLSREDVLEIRRQALKGRHKSEIANDYEINLATVYKAIARAAALNEPAERGKWGDGDER